MATDSNEKMICNSDSLNTLDWWLKKVLTFFRLQFAQKLIQTSIDRSRNPELGSANDWLRKTEKPLADAKKDNDFIYHERIPEEKSLASVGKAIVAKATPMPPKYVLLLNRWFSIRNDLMALKSRLWSIQAWLRCRFIWKPCATSNSPSLSFIFYQKVYSGKSEIKVLHWCSTIKAKQRSLILMCVFEIIILFLC